jgi:divalent metal cation (Fe/Co/Zn/Cd) transporter
MSASSLIGDIRRYASMAIGAILFVVSFTRLREISHWLGEFSQLTPLVMVAVLIAAIGLCTALLELPIRLVRLLVSNKQKQEAQKHELKLGIQEMAM